MNLFLDLFVSFHSCVRTSVKNWSEAFKEENKMGNVDKQCTLGVALSCDKNTQAVELWTVAAR